jgi:hypothetical protein
MGWWAGLNDTMKGTIVGGAIGFASALGGAYFSWRLSLRAEKERWREVVHCGKCNRYSPRYFWYPTAWARGPISRYNEPGVCRRCRVQDEEPLAVIAVPREGEHEWIYNVRNLYQRFKSWRAWGRFVKAHSPPRDS